MLLMKTIGLIKNRIISSTIFLIVKIAYRKSTTNTAIAKITAIITFQFNFQKSGVQSIILELLPVMLSKSSIRLN